MTTPEDSATEEQSSSSSATSQGTRTTQQQHALTLPPPVVDTGSSRPSRHSNSSRESSSRTRSSRRGRSHRSRSNGSRSRSRHRHSSRHHSRHSCRTFMKYQERNFVAASCSSITIILLCTSLEADWITLTGGSCHLLHDFKGGVNHLSTSEFFYGGQFYKSHPLAEPGDHIYKFGYSANDIMVNCVTKPAVLLFKTVSAFIIIAVICTLFAFLLDLIGPTHPMLKLLRRNAIFNILTVVLCVTVNLIAYWITTEVQSLQQYTRLHDGSKVQVTFAVSFYLVTGGASFSVLATAFNCLRRQKAYDPPEPPRNLDHFYFDDAEALLPPHSDPEPIPPLPSNLPPPPAYAP